MFLQPLVFVTRRLNYRQLFLVAILLLIAGSVLSLSLPKYWNLIGAAMLILGLTLSLPLGAWGLPVREPTEEEKQAYEIMSTSFTRFFKELAQTYDLRSLVLLGEAASSTSEKLRSAFRNNPPAYTEDLNTLTRFISAYSSEPSGKVLRGSYGEFVEWCSVFQKGLRRNDRLLVSLAFKYLHQNMDREFPEDKLHKDWAAMREEQTRTLVEASKGAKYAD